MKCVLDDGFIFNVYVCFGMLVNSYGKGVCGGLGVFLVSLFNGDVYVGCFGNEKDNYVELSFGKKFIFNDGLWVCFKIMFVDGVINLDLWV